MRLTSARVSAATRGAPKFAPSTVICTLVGRFRVAGSTAQPFITTVLLNVVL